MNRSPTIALGRTLEPLLDAVADASRRFGLVALDERIGVARRLLESPSQIGVAILGSFKAGKSSFINSLAEAPILPVAAIPATAVLTRVVYGPMLRARVIFASERESTIPVGELAEWSTEARNPDNRKGVSLVEVEAPGMLRELALIDTPGLGSVFAHNTETSLGFLPRVEAAILATPVTQPLSESDLKLARQLTKRTPRCAVLLTKADLCSAEQYDEVSRFTVEQLEQAGIPATVFGWSRDPQFLRLRQRFIEEFLNPLAQSPETSAREIAAHQTRQLAREACDFLDVAIAAAQRGETARRELVTRLNSSHNGPTGVFALLHTFERETRDRCREHAFALFADDVPRLTNGLRRSFAARFPTWHGTLARGMREYETWLRTELKGLVVEASMRRQPQLAGLLVEFSAGCEHLAEVGSGRVASIVQETLGMTVTLPSWKPTVQPPKRPDVDIGRTIDFGFDWLWPLIPLPLVRPLFRRHLAGLLAWEAEKNLSRLTAQWGDELSRRVHDGGAAIREHLERQRRTLIRLCESSENLAPDMIEVRNQLIRSLSA